MTLQKRRKVTRPAVTVTVKSSSEKRKIISYIQDGKKIRNLSFNWRLSNDRNHQVLWLDQDY
ncbi:hypothetical protein BpHYR1_024466 [Brachionus plicatilis]|uniref:Uncharacterized protein n=1 Tax=Brachionus plicatilis TaxID=10195 RepID=A0A3M7PM60_BRAPC|nr:hypothetical protein BpHYR1_024466 [Brachionus plicatilis]